MRSVRKKRSRCASGSGKVPSNSTGFSVASMKNGSGSGVVSPSTLIWPSDIASSSADWVRGVARLISSTSRMLVTIGPCRNSNWPVRAWYTEPPSTSAGNRSGVH